MEECYQFVDNNSWWIASTIFVGYKENDIINMLEKYKYNDLELDGLLIIACWKGTEKVIKYLLGLKANINARSRLGSTPIMFLAQRDWLEMFKYFVENGSDLNMCTHKGHGCSYFAKSRKGNFRVAEYIGKLKQKN
jgi:ankyrin repeat protein